MLPKEAIDEYKKLYFKRYGVQLCDKEASFRSNNLVSLYKAVYSKPPVGLLKQRSNQSLKDDYDNSKIENN